MTLTAVIDTSVIVPVFLTDEAATAGAQELLRLAGTARCQLTTNSHAVLETTAAFHKAVRRDRLTSRAALQMASLLPSLPLERVPVSRVLPQATRIAFEHHMTIYDALFVATALRLRLPLVIADLRQAELARSLIRVMTLGEALQAAAS